jgi:ATP-dependent DNA helicase RecQ
MTGIPGMGERKREQFGALFADEIAAYLRDNARQRFND